MPPRSSSSSSPANTAKLPLPDFIKLLTSNGSLTPLQAMSVAGPLIKNGFSSKASLGGLTDSKLVELGIADSDVRKAVLGVTALKKSGGKGKQATVANLGNKRKRESDLDKPLPKEAKKEVVEVSMEFDENLDEDVLWTKSVVVNRAPVMTAWATVVAEHLGFKRQEALSIAHTFTEMNATSKGVALGIIPTSSSRARDSGVGSSQPYVEIMGRKVPVMPLQGGEWRGIVKGAIAEPSSAFGYIQRSFRQQMGGVIGAMRLLANSFEPQELNEKGYGLYIDFRPQNTAWGEKSQMELRSILELRRFLTHASTSTSTSTGAGGVGKVVKEEEDGHKVEGVEAVRDGAGREDGGRGGEEEVDEGRERKRAKEERQDGIDGLDGVEGPGAGGENEDEFDKALDDGFEVPDDLP